MSLLSLTHSRGTLFYNLDGAMDAMEYQGWKCVVQEGSYTPFNYCKPHRCERLERLKDRFVNLKFDDSIVDILKLDRHFAFIALPNDIAPYPITVVDHRLSLLFVKDDVMAPQPLAYAVRKGLRPFLNELNMAISSTMNSFQTIRKRYKSEYREYVDSHQRKDHTVLSLAHFQILFDVSIKAFGVAVIILVAEILYFRYYGHLRQYCCSAFNSAFAVITRRPKSPDNVHELSSRNVDSNSQKQRWRRESGCSVSAISAVEV